MAAVDASLGKVGWGAGWAETAPSRQHLRRSEGGPNALSQSRPLTEAMIQIRSRSFSSMFKDLSLSHPEINTLPSILGSIC